MYKHLSGRLKQMGVRQKDLARILELSPASVSHRFVGRIPWTIDEMYKMMEICQAPAEQLHIYFPPKGVSHVEQSPSQAEVFPIIVTIKIEQPSASNPQISCKIQQA